MLPEQVAEINRKMELSDSKIIDMGKAMVRVETVLGTVEKTINLLAEGIDDRNEKLSKRLGVLEKWRNWTMGIFGAVTGGCAFFKDQIVNIITNHK